MESLWRKQTGEIEARTGSKEKKEHWEIIVIGAGMAGILTDSRFSPPESIFHTHQ